MKEGWNTKTSGDRMGSFIAYSYSMNGENVHVGCDDKAEMIAAKDISRGVSPLLSQTLCSHARNKTHTKPSLCKVGS